jgi:hypothetical protein
MKHIEFEKKTQKNGFVVFLVLRNKYDISVYLIYIYSQSSFFSFLNNFILSKFINFYRYFFLWNGRIRLEENRVTDF